MGTVPRPRRFAARESLPAPVSLKSVSIQTVKEWFLYFAPQVYGGIALHSFYSLERVPADPRRYVAVAREANGATACLFIMAPDSHRISFTKLRFPPPFMRALADNRSQVPVANVKGTVVTFTVFDHKREPVIYRHQLPVTN